MEALCSQKLPEFQKAVELAQVDLGTPRGRTPASSPADAPATDWARWSEERLLEVQRHRDAMEGEDAFATSRDLLSKIADDLVSFHGYAECERTDGVRLKMGAALERMESKTEKLRRQVCIPPL
jgi:hypothetical protein